MLYYYGTARLLEMISCVVYIKLMDLFVAWKIDDKIERPARLPSMWQTRKGCDIGNVDIVITKKKEGTGFQSWTKWLPGVAKNTLKNRNALSFTYHFILFLLIRLRDTVRSIFIYYDFDPTNMHTLNNNLSGPVF